MPTLGKKSNPRVYRNSRPLLEIQHAGEAMLGNCYSSTRYRITSLRPLSKENLEALRSVGVLGYGQEFFSYQQTVDGKLAPVPETLDWKTRKEIAPSGFDTVQCSEVDAVTNEILRTPSINPYSGEEDPPMERPFYVYLCEDRIDSSG